jgi:glucokinase
MSKKGVILAIDAGGTSLKYALVGFDRIFLSENQAEKIPSFGTRDELLAAFFTIFKKSSELAEGQNSYVVAIGLAVPGPFNISEGISLMRHKWPALYGINLISVFQGSGIFSDNIPVAFISDTHAFMLGEYMRGHARQFRKVTGVILGTGLGFGCMDDGVPLLNETGGPRYIIFSRPWKDGILEDYVTGPGITVLYRNKTGENLTPAEIAVLARDGTSAAAAIYSDIGTLLAINIKEILMEFKTECLVFGGKVSRDFELFRPSLEYGLGHIPNLRLIYSSANSETSALLGAAALMMNGRIY